MLNGITKFLCLLLMLSSWQALAQYIYTVKNKTAYHVYFELATIPGVLAPSPVFARGNIGPNQVQSHPIAGLCIQQANAVAIQPPDGASKTTLPAQADAATYGKGFECKSKDITITVINNKLNIAITDPGP